MNTLLVGSIVGPIGTDDFEAAASLVDSGKGYDFAIGGLGFRVRPTDQTPYERSTAQFRKDQFDSSEEVGDQSLIGWWTRGQFSFHNGAGITFHDSSGETAVNRYLHSIGCDVTEPGKVTLNQAFTELQTGGAFDWMGLTSQSPIEVFAVDGTALKRSSDGGAWTSIVLPANAVVATTSDSFGWVACSDFTIHRVSGTTATHIYTHDTAIEGIWFAKDRLWFIDASKRLYQMAPNPSAPPVVITDSSRVVTLADRYDANWSLADTPGPVLLANGNKVFAFTVGTDGTVPTVTAPVLTAELPRGEYVRGMAHYLGFVVLATSLGVRVGFISDAGQMTYGPRVVDFGAPSATTLAVGGTSVYVAGVAPADAILEGRKGIVEVDLSRQIGNTLEFPWAMYAELADVSSAASGVLPNGSTPWAWSPTKLLGASTTDEQVGTLRTAYHRFGTLEPKKFHTVKVRVTGTAGTVGVARVDVNGSKFPLYTINVADSEGEDITLKMDLPAEMVALEFTLTSATGSTGPTLLGYQLRALPAPKRQRLIRVPLLLHDVERRGTTRATGRPDDAWRRLIELENMEQTGGTFIFQDFRTGESGQCFVEQIEHKGTTPPSRQDPGFGGLVYVTLRVL